VGLGGNCWTGMPLVIWLMKLDQAPAAWALLLPVFQFWS
jgi:hypothetical protein